MGSAKKVKFLLDTHIWIWSLMSSENLSEEIIKELENNQNEFWLSPISVWETIILIEKQRITLNIPIKQWLNEALTKIPVKEASLTNEVAIRSRFVELPHKDPADRFIVATALTYGLTLVTADKYIASSKEASILFNQ